MAISYHIDKTEGIVYSDFSDIITWDDFDKHFKQLHDDKAFSHINFGLCDWSTVKDVNIGSMNMYYLSCICPWREKSHRAVIVPNQHIFAMCRMLQSLSEEKNGLIQIFYDRDEAKIWLKSMRKQTL